MCFDILNHELGAGSRLVASANLFNHLRLAHLAIDRGRGIVLTIVNQKYLAGLPEAPEKLPVWKASGHGFAGRAGKVSSSWKD